MLDQQKVVKKVLKPESHICKLRSYDDMQIRIYWAKVTISTIKRH
jgi:hypothetical protein